MLWLMASPGARATNDISIKFEILHTSQLSWHMQNFVVIGYVYFKLEHFNF